MFLSLLRETEDSDHTECYRELSSLQESADGRDVGETGQICMY